MDARPVMYIRKPTDTIHIRTYENPNTLDWIDVNYVQFGRKQEPMLANELISMNVPTYRIQYKKLSTERTI